ncbi:hypothetical protein U1Q18_014847 [Sarracenia purpurea var. burkii]
MAQNRRSEAEARDVSSSEEDEGSSEENGKQEGSESESEEEEHKISTPRKKRSVPKKSETPKISSHPHSSSSDDSGSESDSESDSPPNNTGRADPNIKPIASKPMEEPPKATKKPRSKPSLATSAVKSSTTAAKVENNSNRESKRPKRKAVDVDKGVEEEMVKKTGNDSKKQLFQRLWSEDDEIAILKGMIEYTAKKGADPVADMNAFHDFIKKSLHVDVSKTQLSDKVRRLKKKYENNASKGKEGEDRTFTKPHEQKAYELSKKVWGGESNSAGIDSTKINGKARKNEKNKGSVVLPKIEGLASPDSKAKEGAKIDVEASGWVSRSIRFNRTIGESCLEDEIIKDGLELITGSKKLELEEKWKKLRVEEVELYYKRVDLIREQTKLVLEAMKSSGH